jgi:hypothetical protein
MTAKGIRDDKGWIPAFAGMTKKAGMSKKARMTIYYLDFI